MFVMIGFEIEKNFDILILPSHPTTIGNFLSVKIHLSKCVVSKFDYSIFMNLEILADNY